MWGDPISLTAADVRNVAFSKALIGKPGYHKDEVDDLLDLVEAAFVTLIEENNDLRSYVEQLDQQPRTVSVETVHDLRPVMMSMRLPMRRQTYPNAIPECASRQSAWRGPKEG